jgi:hypothetical protein
VYVSPRVSQASEFLFVSIKKRYRVQRGKINASAAPTNLLSLGVSILHLKIGKIKGERYVDYL